MRGSAVALLLGLSACRPSTPAPAPLDAGPPASVLVTRLDSVAVQYLPPERRFVAWSPAGAVLWTVVLPDDDALLGRPCVAPDSTVYARGHKGLYALSPDGKVAWDYATQAFDGAEVVGSPAPMRNSGVVLAVAPHTVVALAPDGVEMWRHRLTKQRTLRSAPAVGPNGFISFATSDAVVQLGDDGLVVWDRPTPGPAPQ